MFYDLIEHSLDKLDTESLINMPGFISTMQLDSLRDCSEDASESLTSKLIEKIEAKGLPNARKDEQIKLGGKNFMSILEQLLSKNDGVLKESTKRQVMNGLKANYFQVILQYPQYLLKHDVNYEVFPEVWDLIIKKIDENKAEIQGQQFYQLVQDFDQLQMPADKEHKIWAHF